MRYKLPKGSGIARRRASTHQQVSNWYDFVTTKDVYYTDDELILDHDEAGCHVAIRLTDGYDMLYIITKDLVAMDLEYVTTTQRLRNK